MKNVGLVYRNWLISKVGTTKYAHLELLDILNSIPFKYSMSDDICREQDGLNLRYRFADECDVPYSIVAAALDDKPCSMLEMMVALALRCEENIMHDPAKGDRTGTWFWGMMENLGINNTTDKGVIEAAILRLNNRDYGPNGEGGLFYIPNCKRDLREVDIWYQCMWYLNTVD